MKALKQLLTWFASPAALPALCLLYLAPRVAILFVPVEATSDGIWYFTRAVEMSQGLGYTEDGIPTAFWPPGWPMTLAALFWLFDSSLLTVQIFNLLCSLLTGWLTLDLGRRLFKSEAAGRLALLLLAIYPNNIGYIPLVATEIFYTTLLLSGCRLLIAAQRYRALPVAGLLFGAATLIKAQSLLVIPLIFGVTLLRDAINTRNILAALTKAGVVILTALLVVMPWSYRNHTIFGEWVMVSTNGGLTLLTGNNPSARGDYTPDDPLVTSITRTVQNQLEVDKEARRRGMAWIKENPARFAALMPLKAFRLWAPDGEAEWLYQLGSPLYADHETAFRAIRYANQAYYTLLMLGFGFAGFLLVTRRRRLSPARIDWWLLPYAVALYPTLIAMVFSGQSRFHYPAMPFVVMCCGWLLADWVSHSRSQASNNPAAR